MHSLRPSRCFAGPQLLLAGALLLVVLGAKAQSPAPAPTPPGPSPKTIADLQNVTEWSLSVSVRKLSGRHGLEGEGLLIHTSARTFDHRSADGTAALVIDRSTYALAKAFRAAAPPSKTSDESWIWQGPGTGQLLIDDHSESSDPTAKVDESDTRQADGETPAVVKMTINFTKLTYEFTVEASRFPVLANPKTTEYVTGRDLEIVSRHTETNTQPTEKKEQISLHMAIRNQALPASGTTLEGKLLKKLPNRERELVVWRLTPKTTLPNVIIERTDDTFLPEPGLATGISLRWDHGKPDRVEFRLRNISHEPGICLNSPDRSTGPDAEFAKGQALVAVSGNTASSDQPLRRIQVSTNDYAAYAEVTARALFGTDWVDAKSPEGDDYVAIVPDEDKNKISDFWQDMVGAANHPADWDEDDLPKGTTKKGDNLTLFEEYRGLLVAGGGHHRCDPRRMELIVIDRDKLWDAAAWTKATGASSIVIDDTQHDAQRVNFNSSTAASPHPKYALLLFKVPGLTDPLSLANGNHIWGQTDDAIADHPTTTRIFPDRPREGLTQYLHPKIKNALVNPQSPDGVLLYKEGYTLPLLKSTDMALSNPAVLDRMLQRLVRLVVVHEAAHACGIEHHLPDTEKGEMTCPMRNLSANDKLFRVGQELSANSNAPMPLGVAGLCTTGDDCASHLRLKH